MSAMATHSTKPRAAYDDDGDNFATTSRRELEKDALNIKIIAAVEPMMALALYKNLMKWRRL